MAVSAEELAREVLTSLARRHSTATVLFHHALAEGLGLGPTDHKCVDLLHERGPMSGAQLAALTGLTSGAITGVVTRLERTGWLTREPDPRDGRKQLLRPTDHAVREVQNVLASLPGDPNALLAGFDDAQIAAVHEFLTRGIDYLYQRATALRAQKLLAPGLSAPVPTSEEAAS